MFTISLAKITFIHGISLLFFLASPVLLINFAQLGHYLKPKGYHPSDIVPQVCVMLVFMFEQGTFFLTLNSSEGHIGLFSYFPSYLPYQGYCSKMLFSSGYLSPLIFIFFFPHPRSILIFLNSTQLFFTQNSAVISSCPI